ncbi:hypothetical protein [Pusillimonas sp. T2]|uniref:hypothetical protein n=1 Tax=Pusillimonas sp. T2 TaxID=1548123 RepID=UPI001179B7D9|nr:hypothetical protein [Pusillimonas sp. T2]
MFAVHGGANAAQTKCEQKLAGYEAVLSNVASGSSVNDPDKPFRKEVSAAISGIKNTAPQCDDQRFSPGHLLNSAVHLAHFSPHEARTVTKLYLDYVNRYPYASTQVSVRDIEWIQKVNDEQARQLLDIALERGISFVARLDEYIAIANAESSSPLSKLIGTKRAQLEQLRPVLFAAERAAVTAACPANTCNPEVFNTTYASELRRLGYGDTARARTAENLALILANKTPLADNKAAVRAHQGKNAAATSAGCQNEMASYCQARMDGQLRRPYDYIELTYDECISLAKGWANYDLQDKYFMDIIQEAATSASTERQLYAKTLQCLSQAKKSGSDRGAAASPAKGKGASPSGKQKEYRQATQCISFQTAHGQYPNRIHNGCNFPVLVKWCDNKGCGTEWATDGIKPGATVSISAIKGTYTYAACEYPGSPRATNGGDWPGGMVDYYCRR